MPAPVSVDLRRRVVEAYKRKEGSLVALAARFSVDEKSIRRWLKQEAATGSLAPSSAPRGPKPKINEDSEELLRAMLVEQSDLTNAELVDQLAAVGIQTSPAGVSRALARMGWSRKKNATSRRTR